MDMRHARFDDVPALVAFDATVTRQEWQQILQDPWITVTIAEDQGAMVGWVSYTIEELRQLVLRTDLWVTDAVPELYSEGYRHWRAAATEQVRAWVAEDDPAAAYLRERGWHPTGRRRRIPARPSAFLVEVMLQLPSA